MRIVSSQSGTDILRKKAREDLVWPLRELTANLLRIVRGAGKPHYFARQLAACAEALRAFADAYRRAPSSNEIADILDPEKAWHEARPWINELRAEFARTEDVNPGEAERSEALRVIRRGALQVAASMLMNQSAQHSAGEHEIHQGVRRQQAALAKSHEFYSRGTPAESNASLKRVLAVLKRDNVRKRKRGSDDIVI